MPGLGKLTIKSPKALADMSARLQGMDRQLAQGNALKAFMPELAIALVQNSGSSGNFARGWPPGLSVVPGNKPAMVVRNTFGKSKFVELPTEPHVIRPRRKKVLAWRKGGKGAFSAFKVNPGTKRGAFNFAMEVHHPGTKGKFAFQRTIKETAPRLFQLMYQEIKSYFKI